MHAYLTWLTCHHILVHLLKFFKKQNARILNHRKWHQIEKTRNFSPALSSESTVYPCKVNIGICTVYLLNVYSGCWPILNTKCQSINLPVKTLTRQRLLIEGKLILSCLLFTVVVVIALYKSGASLWFSCKETAKMEYY